MHVVITSALDQAETLKNSIEAESETMQKVKKFLATVKITGNG